MEERKIDYFEHKHTKLFISGIVLVQKYSKLPQQDEEIINFQDEETINLQDERRYLLFPYKFKPLWFLIFIFLLYVSYTLYRDGEDLYAPYILWGALMSFLYCFFG